MLTLRKSWIEQPDPDLRAALEALDPEAEGYAEAYDAAYAAWYDSGRAGWFLEPDYAALQVGPKGIGLVPSTAPKGPAWPRVHCFSLKKQVYPMALDGTARVREISEPNHDPARFADLAEPGGVPYRGEIIEPEKLPAQAVLTLELQNARATYNVVDRLRDEWYCVLVDGEVDDG